MRLTVAFMFPGARSEYYTLPGYNPCVGCANGTLTPIIKNPDTELNETVFYPNPNAESLKLKYILPNDY